MEQITPSVFVETGLMGCNPGFVVTEEGVVMIDTPLEPRAALAWGEKIAQSGDVHYLINTESHLDHFVGNPFFEGIVVSHEAAREAIASASVPNLRKQMKSIYSKPVSLPRSYQVRAPTITFSDRLTLYLGGYTFELLHAPGHTSGQLCVYIPQEKVLFTGDTIFYKVQTFLHDAEPEKWLASLRQLAMVDADVIVPGHGKVCDKRYIKEQAAFIEEWVAAVREAVLNGWSKEKAMKTISFLSRYPMDIGLENTGEEVQRWNVARLYNLLSKEVATKGV